MKKVTVALYVFGSTFSHFYFLLKRASSLHYPEIFWLQTTLQCLRIWNILRCQIRTQHLYQSLYPELPSKLQVCDILSAQCLICKCLLQNRFYKLQVGHGLQVWTKFKASENSEGISPGYQLATTSYHVEYILNHSLLCQVVMWFSTLVGWRGVIF